MGAYEDLSPWWALLKDTGDPEMRMQLDAHSQFCALTLIFSSCEDQYDYTALK
jgi:hypothetical protein